MSAWPGFKPGAAGWEARMLPLCDAAPLLFLFESQRLFSIFSLLPAFLILFLQLHFRADRVPMIGAGQPSGLDY